MAKDTRNGRILTEEDAREVMRVLALRGHAPKRLVKERGRWRVEALYKRTSMPFTVSTKHDARLQAKRDVERDVGKTS